MIILLVFYIYTGLFVVKGKNIIFNIRSALCVWPCEDVFFLIYSKITWTNKSLLVLFFVFLICAQETIAQRSRKSNCAVNSYFCHSVSTIEKKKNTFYNEFFTLEKYKINNHFTHQSENIACASARMSRSNVVAGGTWGSTTGANTPQTPALRPCCASYLPR